MPTSTTNFSFNKPLVNDAIDEDLWGGQLNNNWDSIDTILDQLTPIGSIQAYSGTTSPNAKWLLCDNSAVSRAIYATLFTLVSTNYGIGDGSTTFNLPDYRGRSIVGLDNMGSSSANRITDANADSLNNTGFGSETDAGSISINAVTLAQNNLPAVLNLGFPTANVDDSESNNLASANVTQVSSQTNAFTNAGGGQSFTPTGSYTGTTGSNLPPGIVSAIIIRAL